MTGPLFSWITMSNSINALKPTALIKLLELDGFTLKRRNANGCYLYGRDGEHPMTILVHPTKTQQGPSLQKIFKTLGWSPTGPVIASSKKKKFDTASSTVVKKEKRPEPTEEPMIDPKTVPSNRAVTQDNPKEALVDDDRKIEAIIYEDEHGTLKAVERFATTRTQLKQWREQVGAVKDARDAAPPPVGKPDFRIKSLPKPIQKPVYNTRRSRSTAEEKVTYAKAIGELILADQSPWTIANELKMKNDVRQIREGTYWALEPDLAAKLKAKWTASAQSRSARYESFRRPMALPPSPSVAVAKEYVIKPAPKPVVAPVKAPVREAPIIKEETKAVDELQELRNLVVEQMLEIRRLKAELARLR